MDTTPTTGSSSPPGLISHFLPRSDHPISQSEASFQAAFDASGIGMAICTVEGQWIRVNESMSRIIGYSREQLLGLTFLEITHPEDIQYSIQSMDQLLSGSEKVYRIEKRYIHAQGHAIWVKLTVSGVYDSEGKTLFFVSQIEDVTKNRQLERELKTVNERLALAAKAGGVGVWDWDVVNDHMEWDQQMYTLYGLESDQFKGTISACQPFLHPEDWPRVLRKVQETLRREESLNIPFRVVRPNGQVRHLRAFAIVKRDDQGKPIRMVGTNWDITESVQHKENLQQLAEKANQASEAKSQFLANISHEIRTPLNGVIGMTHLLLDTPGLEDPHRETANLILSSSESLMKLINQILNFAKAESGKLELDIHRFNLRAMIRQTTSPIEIRAQKVGITFSVHIDKKTPQRLRGDSGKLQQVIQNLADNAIKFTDKGSIELNVRVIKEERNNVLMRFAIKDSGIGIDQEVQKRLFSAFTQADASTTRLYGGTGLGLAISKEIVELMGGEIGIISQPGQGSEFWFTAEFEKAPETASGFPGPFTPRSMKKDANSPAEQSRERVRKRAPHALLVEDNHVNQLVANGMLDHLGVTVDTVSNGLEAIEAIRETEYDIVFMDIQMPVVDGLEATIAIREWEAEEKRRNTPVVAMTAHARAEDRRACIAAGMNECIVKPFSPDKLVEIIESSLGKKIQSPTEIAAENAALFDFEELAHRLGEDDSLINEVLTISIEDLKRIVGEYQASVAKKDSSAAAMQLHTLIGVAASASFRRLAAAASVLEAHLKETGEIISDKDAPHLDHILKESLTAALSFLANSPPEE